MKTLLDIYHQRAQQFYRAAIAVTASLGVASAMAFAPALAQMAQQPQQMTQVQPAAPKPAQQWISEAFYNDKTGHLIIQNQNGLPLQAQNIVQSPRNQEISFYMPNTAIQPSPKHLRIAPDPLIEGITLEQRALNGVPSVKVTVNLFTKSPYVPFSIVPQHPGLNVYLGKIAFANPSTAPVVQPARPVIAAAPVQRPVAQAPQPVANRPLPPAIAQTTTVNTYGPAVRPTTPQGQQSALTYGPAPAAARPVAKGVYGIDDIFYDHNIVTLFSKNGPLVIDRVFTLKEPNRYVIDIAASNMNPDLLDRVIPNLHPSIRSIRVSQFDVDTARLVIEFSATHQQVQLTQSPDRRTVRLAL